MNQSKQRAVCSNPEGADILPKRRIAGWIARTGAICVAGLLAVAVSATVQASVINYQIHNNGGLLTNVGRFDPDKAMPVSIAGQFTYNTSTMAITHFNVTFVTEAPFNGTYTDDSHPYVSGQRIGFSGVNAGGGLTDISLYLDGFGDLSEYLILGADVVLGGAVYYDVYFNDANKYPYLVGWTAGEPEVPEPSTWAMVLGAFAGAATWMRVRRRVVTGTAPVIGSQA